MASLRARLAGLVAVSLGILMLVATVSILFERWQEANASLTNAVELAAFQLSETTDATNPTFTIDRGIDPLSISFDANAEVIGSTGDIDEQLREILIEDIWAFTTEQDQVLTVRLEDDAGDLIVSGVACVDQDVCDTIVVGASEEPLGSFILRNLGWILGPTLGALVLGWFATRWLVGRSLQPVDAMRSELDRITATDLDRRVPVPETGDELERLGASMNHTIARLGSAVSANERFVADAAHELRSPIAGVKAALELEAGRRSPAAGLGSEGKGAEGGTGLLDDSVRELNRAARLVDDLLVLARRDGAARPHRDVDLDDVVRSALDQAGSRHGGTQITKAVSPVRVRGDADALHRVVTNLVDNAARYGGGSVSVRLESDGPVAVLVVDDDGPGIPAEHRTVVFERFARLDESRARATGGSGLGLAIAKELVEDHGGSITVGDAALGGASFAVRLPL